MFKLYDFLPYGNGYKVRLLLIQLQIPFELIELNILNKETRTPEFLQKNPNGKIPVLEIAPEQFISESKAILAWFNRIESQPRYLKISDRPNEKIQHQ